MKRSRLRAKSEKQREIDRRRAAIKAAKLVEAGVFTSDVRPHGKDIERACAGRLLVPEVVCSSWRLDRPALELHEIVKRSRSRAGALDPENCVLLCQAHHEWTEAEVTAATERGLLRHGGNVDPFDKFDSYHPEEGDDGDIDDREDLPRR